MCGVGDVRRWGGDGRRLGGGVRMYCMEKIFLI